MPITTANVPTPLKQGVKAVPAKQHTSHKAAVKQAAKVAKQARTR